MKDAHLRIRSLLAALVLLSLTAFGAKAQESGTEFLADLHQFRIQNYLALDAFYIFSATSDTEVLNRVVAGINNANDAMNNVGSSTSGVLSENQIEELNQVFDQFKNLMRDNINEVRDRGYPDLRLMAELADQAYTMNEKATELYGIARESSDVETSEQVESARSAAVLMAQMMARYSARTHSSVSQTFQGAAGEVALDEQADMFDQLLERARTGSASGDVKTTLEDVAAKWEFIRGSYVNYNENNVSFIIDRYSKGIIQGLDDAIELLRNNA
jgi:hypothetical protein